MSFGQVEVWPPQIDIRKTSSIRSWANSLISNPGQQVALGGVLKQNSRGGSRAFDHLTLDADSRLQFGDTRSQARNLITLTDISVASVSNGLTRGYRVCGLLEHVDEVIRKIANDQMHSEISVLISDSQAAAADQVE